MFPTSIFVGVGHCRWRLCEFVPGRVCNPTWTACDIAGRGAVGGLRLRREWLAAGVSFAEALQRRPVGKDIARRLAEARLRVLRTSPSARKEGGGASYGRTRTSGDAEAAQTASPSQPDVRVIRRWVYPVLRRLLGERAWEAARAAYRARQRIRRDSRERLLGRLPQRGVCAEVGVWKGEFSTRILRRTRPKALHLIDAWQFQPAYPGRSYGGEGAKDQNDMERIFDDLRVRLANEPNVFVHRGMSRDVLRTFDEAYFDWVYIDA